MQEPGCEATQRKRNKRKEWKVGSPTAKKQDPFFLFLLTRIGIYRWPFMMRHTTAVSIF